MEEGDAAGRLTKTVKIGGYIIEAGSIVGFSIGIYFLFNHSIFSSLFRIGQSEVTAYFIGVFMPSFIVLAIIGYLFVMPLGPRKAELSNVVSLCVMSFLVIILSAFSILYFISLAGGFLVLTASVRTFTKPSFKTLSKRETFFLVEIGALLIASFSTLFLIMQISSSLFQTYSTSSYGTYTTYTLLIVVFLSFLTFFGVPLLGSSGTHAGVSGTLGLVTTVLSLVFIAQNQYAILNISALLGASMLFLGVSLSMIGNIVYLWLFLSEIVATEVFSVSPLDRGKYCPYCGSPRLIAVASLCSSCGRNLTWTPYAPFCSSCGLLVPKDAPTCPHCKEDLSSKRIYYYGQFQKDKTILDRATDKLSQQKTLRARIQSLILLGLKRIVGLVHRFGKLLTVVDEKLSLTLKDVVFIVILCFAFNFLSFIIPNRWDIVDIGYGYQTYGNFYGYPFEWLLVKRGGFPPVLIFWGALLLDILFYLLLAALVVTVIEKLRPRSQ